MRAKRFLYASDTKAHFYAADAAVHLYAPDRSTCIRDHGVSRKMGVEITKMKIGLWQKLKHAF